MKVLKFGGSSVASADSIQQVAAILKRQAGDSIQAVVVSALGGVTNTLLRLAAKASAGDSSYKEDLEQLLARHRETAQELASDREQEALIPALENLQTKLADVLQGIYQVRECTPRSQDYVLSFGERFSAQIIAATLRSSGHAAEYLDARTLIKTNNEFGKARVDFSVTRKNIQEYFSSNPTLQIATGFIAESTDGTTTTLGRGGSDYTAAILGTALGADQIELWTDVDGMLTADPRLVPKAFPIPQVTYVEAMELCHFGAKVIHPPTLQPAFEAEIPILIKNTFNPDAPGTKISLDTGGHSFDVTGISSIHEVALLRVQGPGMVGVTGVSRRLFGSLSENGINVILITQASSEHTVCFAVNPEDADKARTCIEAEFELERSVGHVDDVIVERELSIVSAVGENMRHTPGIAARLFGALARNGVNVVAIAQGSSERNISVVVSKQDEGKALRSIHDGFFLSGTRALNIYLVGKGLIGSALLSQFADQEEYLRKELSIELRLVGIAGSAEMLIDEDGIPLARAVDTLSAHGIKGSVSSFVDRLLEENLPSSVFVDCSASEDVVTQYPRLLEHSVSIVTPNKKAQSASYADYQKLRMLSKKRGVSFLYETSVGAGLPVINTLNDLLKSGDEILRIEGVLSGTLSYIFNSFDGSVPFSEVVTQAKEKGYTEPDPRDDLNGLDVARKILILAREAGAELEPKDVSVENLVPEQCRNVDSVEEFFVALKDSDAYFEKKLLSAKDSGKRLRYIASFEAGQARISLEEVDVTHPFYDLSLSDNIIAMTTRRYHDRPLVVKGPGAGAQVTAAGVFADVIKVLP